MGVFKSSINVPTQEAKFPSKPIKTAFLIKPFTKLCWWRTSKIKAFKDLYVALKSLTVRAWLASF